MTTQDKLHKILDRRLHVMTIEACNNNCIFCCNRYPHMIVRPPSGQALSVDEFSNEYKKLNEMDSILFTGGESTLHPNLIMLVAKARSMGYKNIALQTNGRILRYKNFCTGLLESGLTEISISLHGSSAKIHNDMVRVNSAFEETTLGLRNMISLKKKYQHVVNASCTITRLNYKDMANYLLFISSLQGVDNVVLNTLMFSGNAKRYFKQLFVSYTDIAQEIKSAIRKVSGTNRVSSFPFRVLVQPMPVCLMKNFENFVGIQEFPLKIKTKDIRILKRGTGTLKPKKCLECNAVNKCNGIDTYYAISFGANELTVIKKVHN